MQSLRRPPFPIKCRIKSPKQRRFPWPINNHPQRNVIRSRGITWSIIFNSKTEVPMRKTLEYLVHPQPRTPIQTYNKISDGLINNKIDAKATKSIGMKFNWLQYRYIQEQFRYFWRPGHTNLGDYWTKHHPGAHHKDLRPTIITLSKFLDAMSASIK